MMLGWSAAKAIAGASMRIVSVSVFIMMSQDFCRVGPAAAKPRRPTIINVQTWWAGARVRLLVPPYDLRSLHLNAAIGVMMRLMIEEPHIQRIFRQQR